MDGKGKKIEKSEEDLTYPESIDTEVDTESHSIQVAKMTRYAIAAYHVNPKVERVCTQYNSGIIPESRCDYYFCNIGLTACDCKVMYGTGAAWYGLIAQRKLNPGEAGVVPTGGRSYYVTGQKVYNFGDRRAIIHCSTVNGYNSFEDGNEIPLKIDINNLAKKLVVFGVGKIPYVGGVISVLTNFFWPENEKSAWDQVKDQVVGLVDQKVKEAIQGILGGDIRYMRERIFVLKLELEDPKSKDVNTHYMNIAQDLIGFEKKFSFSPNDNSDSKNVNYYLLPLYCAVVNMKVLMYQFGIINQSKMKLTNDNIYDIKKYLQRLIEEKNDGAIAYINKVFEDQYNVVYDTVYVDTIYNELACVRQFCAINGTEFFEYWKSIVANPFVEKKPYNPVISYSTIFSRPTPILSTQIVPADVPVPLQPKLINGKRNKMTKLEVWIFRMRGGSPKIQGCKIYYENGDTFDLGKWSSEAVTINFNGKYLKKLTVWGNNALDMLECVFDDGSYQSAGSNADSWGKHQVFELEDHHIAGLYIANDATALGGQSAGIAVSYQVTPQ